MNGERPRTEEAFPALLLITHVSVARGRVAAPLLGAIAVLPVLHFVHALLRGPISDIGPYAAALPISAMAGVLSAYIAKRRVRTMTIERRRDGVILEVAEVRLRFPLRLLGEQQTYHRQRIASHWLYLQAVGQDGTSVVFLERRGSLSTRETGWLASGIDRTLPHTEIDLNAPAGMSIVELRAAIEKANASLHEAAGPEASDPAPAPARKFVPPVPRSIEQGTSLCAGTMDGRSYEVFASSDMGKLWLVERDPPLAVDASKPLDLTIDPEYAASAASIRVDERGLSVTVHAEHKRGGTLKDFSWFVPRGRGLSG